MTLPDDPKEDRDSARRVIVKIVERIRNYLEEPNSDESYGFGGNRRFFAVVGEYPICDVAMIYDEMDRFG